MKKVVQVENVRKVFISVKKKFLKVIEKKEFIAVEGVSFDIYKGEIFGLLGPNGAGKTTTIKMITGLLRPTSGRVLVNGVDVEKESSKALGQIGTVLAGDRSIYWKLTARENLEYFASLYGFSKKEAKLRAEKILKKLDIIEKADETVEKFSTGMKQKVALGKALIPDAPVVLLDEPTLGLDPQSALNLREIITSLKNEGKTILLTTHYMEEADFLCDRIAIVDGGKIITLDTPDNLKKTISDVRSIKVEVNSISDEITSKLKKLESIKSVTVSYMEERNSYEVLIHHEEKENIVQEIIDFLGLNKISIKSMNVVIPSLEDVFIHLTGKKLRD
ncbi:ABC transporter ATP-binding protein [Clostridium folliculivorans]|uniref:Daunorubicin resistance protein DrrA family ABC transporter ATP-binding protein n=1 Tax=Clostridium folliculivorans TaxID=2886038 RepID=A0A9W6DBR9_9CLOT|nr:ATP-binding cassette domain-containing protein [Clostridium folliculivorans]GKU26207.1 daunorubicin resistance protein DrrA family ABC transporter ATP-binding protein [Clostridium folliculivorans]GKU31879.1 daunorubicin resistance protein DrrA family ABC transporter ATP-binding protein [Clostridium folliculivorans]